MCAPGVMAATTVAAAGVSIYAQQKKASFDAQVARNNAELMRHYGAASRNIGEIQASQIEAEGRRVAGSATAVVAASGIDTTVGSAAGAIAESHAVSAADAAAVRANVAREAWGYRARATELKTQAGMSRRAGILGGVSTGLSALGGLMSGMARS